MGADQQISSIRAAVSGLLSMGWSPSGRTRKVRERVE